MERNSLQLRHILGHLVIPHCLLGGAPSVLDVYGRCSCCFLWITHSSEPHNQNHFIKCVDVCYLLTSIGLFCSQLLNSHAYVHPHRCNNKGLHNRKGKFGFSYPGTWRCSSRYHLCPPSCKTSGRCQSRNHSQSRTPPDPEPGERPNTRTHGATVPLYSCSNSNQSLRRSFPPTHCSLRQVCSVSFFQLHLYLATSLSCISMTPVTHQWSESVSSFVDSPDSVQFDLNHVFLAGRVR